MNDTVKERNKAMQDLIASPFRDIWEMMDALTRPLDPKRDVMTCGLKSVIKRPHNLVNVKDKDGNVVGQRLEIVTTPFKKEDVKITMRDNVLTVQCGAENIKDEENEEVIYRGISAQSYTFSLSLAPTIDQTLITAENKDGILRINLPYVAKDVAKDTVEIAIA